MEIHRILYRIAGQTVVLNCDLSRLFIHCRILYRRGIQRVKGIYLYPAYLLIFAGVQHNADSRGLDLNINTLPVCCLKTYIIGGNALILIYIHICRNILNRHCNKRHIRGVYLIAAAVGENAAALHLNDNGDVIIGVFKLTDGRVIPYPYTDEISV